MESVGYLLGVATGHVEELKRGFRAVAYAGKDPITGRKVYLKETYPTRGAAEDARNRLISQVEAERVPDQAAKLAYLLDRWVEVSDHELTTRQTNEGYIRRTRKPALGDMQLRKLQHRVDVLDRLYTHFRRCSALCDGRAVAEHRCKPMSPGAIRRVHAILSAALGYAVSWGWIGRNPASTRTRPS